MINGTTASAGSPIIDTSAANAVIASTAPAAVAATQ